MKKIFLTGASGFVGRNLVNRLLKLNYTIVATAKQKKKIKNITYIKKRLCDVKVEDFKDCSALFHFATVGAKNYYLNKSFYNNYEYLYQVNVIDSLKLINNAIKAGIKKIVIAGSAFEYGYSSYKYKKIPTNSPLLPKGYYAMTKCSLYLHLKDFFKKKDISIIYLRFFQLYGKFEKKPRLFPSLLASLKDKKTFYVNNASLIRDFINVEDAVVKTIEIFKNTKKRQFITHNIGSGKPVSVKSFVIKTLKDFKIKKKVNFRNLNTNQLKYLVAKINNYL